MSTCKKIGSILYKGLLIIVICMSILNTWMFINHVVLKKEVPQLFGYAQLVVLSGSMDPTLKVGDLIVVHEEQAYEEQDIITFRTETAPTTHRIVETKDTGFITKGDANNVEDEGIVTKNQIYGRVVMVIPKVGEWMLFMKQPVSMLIMILVLCVLLWGKDFIQLFK